MKALPLGEKLTIAIDVDGTVADCKDIDFEKVKKDPYELMKAKPIKGALDAVKKLFAEGHKIVFHTSRDDSSKGVTKQWLEKHGFPFHHIECDKFVAHVYIDDRAISGREWDRVMEELETPDLPGKIARKNRRI